MIQMMANRELDEAIAVEVMGWIKPSREYEPWKDADGMVVCTPHALPHFSAKFEHVELVIKKMATIGNDMSRGFQLELRTYYGDYRDYPPAAVARFLANPPGPWCREEYWHANEDKDAGRGTTVPHAICLAALAAVGALPTPTPTEDGE